MGRLEDAQDRERRLLAESLHDDVLLTAVLIRRQLARQHPLNPELVCDVDGLIAQLRDAMFDLHPHALERVGLGPVLEQLAARLVKRSATPIAVTVQPGDYHPGLYPIARELLVNAIKHADASNVWLTLEHDPHTTTLTIADDGRGIDLTHAVTAAREGHVGLESVRHRAHILHGTLHFESVSRQAIRTLWRVGSGVGSSSEVGSAGAAR